MDTIRTDFVRDTKRKPGRHHNAAVVYTSYLQSGKGKVTYDLAAGVTIKLYSLGSTERKKGGTHESN